MRADQKFMNVAFSLATSSSEVHFGPSTVLGNRNVKVPLDSRLHSHYLSPGGVAYL